MTHAERYLDILVPREGMDPSTPEARQAAHILPRSGIVAGPYGHGYAVSFEGAMYGKEMDFAKKLLHAADRHTSRYPTVACFMLPAEKVIKAFHVVGRYDALRLVIADVFDAAALEAWAGEATSKIFPTCRPAGPIAQADAEELTRNQFPAWVYGPMQAWMTKSGQVLFVDFSRGRLHLFDADDEELASLLRSDHAEDATFQRLTGRAA